jgi:hypothetical protein
MDRRRILLQFVSQLLLHSNLVMSQVIISNPPVNVTAATGSNLTFNCSPQQNYSGFFEWRFFSSVDNHQIYSFEPFTFKTNLFPPSRFHRVGQYGLSITSLETKDGGIYGCRFLTDDVNAFVTVVVIDQPVTTVSPAEVKLDDTVTLTCRVQFGGPINSTTNYNAGQFPQLDMYFNGQRLDGPVSYDPGQPDVTPHTLTRTKSLPVTKSDSYSQQVECRVTTDNPPLIVTSNATLFVKLPVSDVIITPYSNKYAVSEVVTCSAPGYPAPDITWVAVSTSGVVTVVKGQNLNISTDMMGNNVWNCTAGNELNIHKVNKQISFTVLAEKPPEGQSTSGAMIGLGVGLAIGLSLLLTAIILVVAFIVKRRRRTSGKGQPPTIDDSQSQQPFIYNPKPNNASTGHNPEGDFHPNNRNDKPVAKPRLTSTTSTLEPGEPAGGFADLSGRPQPKQRSTLRGSQESLDTPGDKALHKPRPVYKGSQESLDTSIDKRPMPSDRPKPSQRTGSIESLDKLEGAAKPHPAQRQTRASNESLDRSLDSDGRPRPAQRSKVKDGSLMNASLDSGVKVGAGDRSRDSMDQSRDSYGKPRPPGVAPKPGKKHNAGGNKVPAGDRSGDISTDV